VESRVYRRASRDVRDNKLSPRACSA
jgi:hypothetical protein